MTKTKLNFLLPEQCLSIDEVTAYITELLEGDRFLNQLWVIGEVSSAKSISSGTFFTLTDEETNSALSCVVWRNQREKLTQQPQVGEQLIVLGSIRIYRQKGEYRLHVWEALPAGEGLQALRLQQLRSQLAAEGLFSPQRKRALPFLPQTIAVVTSATAAAWGDIQKTLQQRYPGLQVLFSPATVQGIQAPASIVTAIERVNQDGRAEVIVLARGGGATEDLSCFNDERVVRAIASSSIPVVTGIGHERDESLADLAADVCAHTPTAAAELVVPSHVQLVSEHQQRVRRLTEVLTRKISQETEYLAQLKQKLSKLPFSSRKLLQATSRLQLLQEKLNALNPQAVLKRGYAVVRKSNGELVRNADDVSKGEELIIQLAEGKLKVLIVDC